MKLLVLCGILLSCLVGIQCQENGPPILAEGLKVIYVKEDAPAESWVFKILAFDPEQDKITFGISGDYFHINPNTGDLRVNRILDYEQLQNITVQISATDGTTKVYRKVLIKFNDTNDEIPEFTREFYQVRLPENTAVGTNVLRDLSVTDRDAPNTNNGDITVVCIREARANEMEPCDYFRVDTDSSSGQAWRGHLVLIKKLDFEKYPSFSVPLQASDGVNTRRTAVAVTVVDVQDSPPVFVVPLSATLPEDSRVGTSVMTFSASDGDGGDGTGIQYQLVFNPGGYFALDSRTGVLTTARTIDGESLFNRLITIQVAAVEGSAGDGGDSTTRTLTQATITVEDKNDNAPTFVAIKPPVVTIKEDIATSTPLPTSVTITDADEGTNSQFVLKLLNFNDIFEVYPAIGRGSLTASIRVKDTSKIDFESGPRQYILRLQAQEGLTAERRVATDSLTVNIEDVNDNPPVFPRSSYVAQVSELAEGGTVVTTITATDRDSGIYGKKGLRYKLTGNGANLFQVNRLTGEIKTRPCGTPGTGNCPDYEKQPFYDLVLLVRDNYAEGFEATTKVRINILDENDNSPRFRLSNYESFINEGDVSPDPPVTVQATDADSGRNGNNVITYSIIGGNANGLWQIGFTSGVVSATRPVDFASTPGGSGVYTLTVQAADPRFKTTGTVRITVRDSNSFTPRFFPSTYYEVYIPEDSLPGASVGLVQAYDDDPSNSPNGQVRYRIASGSQDQFIINPNSGIITVNDGARFDFDRQKRYEMQVIAEDQGTPTRSATATVVVNIRDSNNKKPFFDPSSVRVNIKENATVNTRVTQMTAQDPDSNAVLIYSFVQPFTAWGPNGRRVDPNTYNFADLFAIDPNSGIVRTRRLLNRDKAAVISTNVHVRDTTGSAEQTALASLIINILEVNDRAPQFPHPWTPNNQFLNISVREELPAYFYVTTIQATDPHDSVSDYKIINDPGDYFNINPVTGVVTIKRKIDYEQTQKTFFVVTAADNGRPPLTSTATINVNVININDNSPSFTEIEYDINLDENSPTGTTVVDIGATDLDLGEFGTVRYSLKDPLNQFTIDPITGVVTVKDGASLDREKVNVITLSVEAYDSPNNPNDRKSTSIPIYITLTDTNDHTPTFVQKVYETTVSENVPVQYSVIQVMATDGDTGQFAKLTYFILTGDPSGLFTINPVTGLITTRQPLEGRARQYNVTVGVRDGGTPALVGRALAIINVEEANNEAPVWIWPAFDNQTISVLENQYMGMVITNKVKATDEGEGDNGVITYGFYYNDQFVAETPYFRINPITGIITARAIYDREARDEYVVKLVARDGGNPPFETTRFVIIKVLDTDDHDPVFPTYRNCCVIPINYIVRENLPRMQRVGQVNATDLDIGQNAETRYSIIGGNDGNAFYVNKTTGIIYTNKSLDHEVKAGYMLAIRASNLRTKNRPNLNPLCKCLDPSVILVKVDVENRNDFPPVFANSVYNACVSYDAQIGKSVTTIRAQDPDSLVPNSILYNLRSITLWQPREKSYIYDTNDVFKIGNTNGTVYTDMLMMLYRDKYFSMKVLAQDRSNLTDRGSLSSNATLMIFVTDPASEVLVTVKEPVEQVKQGRLEEVVQWITEVTGGIVCVNDVRVYMDANRNLNAKWTDILLHVVDGNSYEVWKADRVGALLWPGGGAGGAAGGMADSLLISNVAAANSFWSGFAIDPLLAAVILTLLLLLLLLLLLCCICCCAKTLSGRHAAAKSGLMIQPSGQINPLWKEKLYEDQELNMKLDTVDHAAGGAANAGFVMGEDATARLALGGGAGGMTTTHTETTRHEYAMNYEHTSTQQAMDGGTTLSIGGGPRIEAPLEGGASQAQAAASMLNGSVGGMSGGGLTLSGLGMSRSQNQSLMADSATQVELMASRASLRDEGTSGPSAIGARLHSYNLDGAQEVHSNSFYNSVNRVRDDDYGTSLSRQGAMSAGNVVHDIYVEDSDRSMHHGDNPDGLYQGEIILGSYHLPQFPNHQRQETRYRTESNQYLYDGNYN